MTLSPALDERADLRVESVSEREPFLSTLNYTASSEDTLSERKALRIRDTDTVLSITSSGDRTLELLLDRPAAVVSVDINPSQNHLLELKLAALRLLNYEEFIRFLGLSPAGDRIDTWRRLRPNLKPEPRAYLVRRGIPPEVRPLVEREEPAEEALLRTDRSIFYRFLVARIER